MGQHLSNINSQIVNLLESNYSIPSPSTVVASVGPEDISLFLSSEISSNIINDKYQISKQWTKQIQNYLYHLIHIPDFEIINTQMDNIYTSIITDYKQIIQELNNNFEKHEKLKISFLNKLKNDNNNKQESTPLKLTERYVSTETHHLPRSIIINPSLSNNRFTEKQLETILNKFLTSNTSFKDILFVLNRFLFDTNNVYDLRNIFTQFNDHFLANRREWENEQMTNNNQTVRQTIDAKLFAHLTSIGAFPNNRLKKQFTGQFISVFIFTHIDFHNTINTNKQFNSGSIQNKVINLAEILLIHWNDIQILSSSISINKNWFHQIIDYLNIEKNFTEWIQDKSQIIEQTDLTYQLIDINQSNQEKAILINNNQWKNIDMSLLKYHEYRISCEYRLISIYAHYTILNMLRIWSYDGSCLFPLEKFGDCTFIIKLLRLLDYHYRYTRLHTDETIDRMSLLINSILKIELNELIKYNKRKHDKITYDILQSKTPLLYHLQKDIMIQSINILIDPSLLNLDNNDEYDIEKSNIKFILKLIQLFVKLISEKSTIKQEDIDLLIPVLFPESLINILFNLFILNLKHEDKSIILHLFSTLIQTSHNFNLNKNIENFLFHLFIELPPNSTSINTQTMRTLQIAIMDLVFLLIEKHQSMSTDITNELSKLPKNFHDLLILIDVIKALTDKTKHTIFPEMFIIESIILLGENLQLTRDDIEKSNQYFDTISDLQLIHFMNNNQLLKISFIEFIHSLPTESISNSSYYKNYPSLWHIPAIYIQIRAKIIYEFNIIIEKLVSFIDLSLFPGQSILTDKIQKIKSYILYEIKSNLFDTTVTITSLEINQNIPTVNFDTVNINSTTTHTMFNQAYEQLHEHAHITFRNEYDQIWRAQYLAMHSTDQGGPFRDSVTHICSDICSTRLSLFILCPNGRINSGLNDDRWIPNIYSPNELISNRIKKQYQFIGQLMGMAIRKKHYLYFKFPSLLWKQLVREQITIEDIENIDIQSFTIINEMEKIIKQNNSSIDTNELLNNILDELRFEVLSSNGQTYELVPNGKNIPITLSNFKDYCSYYREYRLNEFYRQIDCIRQGLYSVIPGYFLSLFTANELEEMICGKGEMDVELLKRNTIYEKYSMKNRKKMFLKFVWGRCTLPNCDDDFETKFHIEPYILSNELIDGALPRAHTCTFVLDLPEYSTIDIMYDRLNYAITYCTSIDGDGNMNEAPIPTDLESDSATED
ncbi:unnamed protein product [Rotaria sp. Silwood1]|nr:unnamed protein product [Rotaria sp. Silwood1]